MLKSSLLTLAAVEWEKIVTAAVFVIIVFGSAIANLVKKWLETQEQNKKRAQGGQSQEGGQLDDLAARRREQLRAQTRQRQQQQQQQHTQGSQARPGGSDPANLTMAQRIARARAQAQYEKRSGQLQQGAPPQSSHGRAPETAAQEMQRRQQAAQQQARAQQAQQLAQQRTAQKAQARARAQQALQAQQTRQQAALAAQQQQRSRRRSSASMAQSARRMEVATKHDTGKSVVHRHVPDASPTAIAPHLLSVGEHLDAKMLTPRSLRHAVMLKEILDKPLALR